MHELASSVSLRTVDWFTTNYVLVAVIEVLEVRWRTQDKLLEEGLVEGENVAPVNDLYVNVVEPDLPKGKVKG